MIILHIRNVLLVVLMLQIFAVMAQETTTGSTLTWTPPTSRVDGTPLDPATELSFYKLWCGDKETRIPATSEPNTTYEFSREEILPGYGSYECRMEAFDTSNPPLWSEPSNAVTISWEETPQPPRAPTNLIYITDGPAPNPEGAEQRTQQPLRDAQ